MRQLRDASHPIWPLLRTFLFLVSLSLILWMNAEHFDDTELKTITSMFLGALGIEGVTSAITKTRTGKSAD